MLTHKHRYRLVEALDWMYYFECVDCESMISINRILFINRLLGRIK